MKIELALDRAGLWWTGLGFSLHVFNDRRPAGEPAVSWQRQGQGQGSRSFRLWSLEGVMSRAV